MTDRITRTSDLGKELIVHFEGIKMVAYQCSAGVWTIGVGTTRYPDGSKVKQGDRLKTRADAMKLLDIDLKAAEKAVDDLTRDDITQSQFDALVSFVYNLGEPALRGSTLLAYVNGNAEKEAIRKEFLKWDNVRKNGKLVEEPGLTRRRKSEAWLYLTGEFKTFQ
ncbi:MAG: lysozyme [Flavipsychrobacter sp.]